MMRNSTVDLAKGVAICLMVIGHCYSSENVVLTTIYAFHMPFFFIISGMLYADKWKNGVSIHIIKLCAKLLVPYACFEMLFLFFILLLRRTQDIINVFGSAVVKTILPMVGATVTWFLPCQLLTVVFSAVILKRTAKCNKVISVFLFTIPFVFVLLYPVSNRYLLVLWRALVGVGFFAVGYYGKPWIVRVVKPTILFFLSLLFVVSASVNGPVSLVEMKLSNPLLYSVNGVLGTYILYQICSIVERTSVLHKLVSYFGKNTAIILCTHMFVVEFIRLIDYKLLGNVLRQCGLFEGFVFGGIILMTMLAVIPVFNRRCFWWLFGRKRTRTL